MPADHGLSVGGGDGACAVYKRQEVGLRRCERLVTADVDPRAGGQLHQFGHDILDELVGALLADAQRGEPDLDALVERRSLAVAGQLRVGGERRIGMAGQIDLRHDGHVPARRVGDDLAVVVLRVVATASAVCLGQAAVLSQARPALDLDAPALVVGEVQVQDVELEQGHVVDVALHVVDAEEVARDVEHRAAVGEARVVGDRRRRDRPFGRGGHRARGGCLARGGHRARGGRFARDGCLARGGRLARGGCRIR